MADIDKYAGALKSGGRMFLSGFYVEDVSMLEEKAQEFSLKLESVKEKNRWANMALVKL